MAARIGRRVLLPVLTALPVLALLVGLGVWQLQRLAWKTGLLARIDAAEAAPPAPLGPDPAPYSPAPYSKVSATGRFEAGREALYGVEVRDQQLGAHLVVPLIRADAPPLLVDRGWVPMQRQEPLDQPEGQVTVTGYVRPPDERSWLSAADDAPARRFYTFDPAAIGAALGLPRVAPFGLVALARPGLPPRALPQPAQHLPRPDNPHLGYAFTWFGLAAALLGVLAVFLHRRLREATA